MIHCQVTKYSKTAKLTPNDSGMRWWSLPESVRTCYKTDFLMLLSFLLWLDVIFQQRPFLLVVFYYHLKKTPNHIFKLQCCFTFCERSFFIVSCSCLLNAGFLPIVLCSWEFWVWLWRWPSPKIKVAKTQDSDLGDPTPTSSTHERMNLK